MYPTTALAAYDFKRKTKDIASVLGRKEDEPEVMTITDQTTEAGICEFGFAGGYWEQNWRFASSRCGGGIYMPRGAVLSHTGTS